MEIENLSYAEARSQLGQLPSTSFWLRTAIKALEARDPINALNDAEILLLLSRKRLDDLVALQTKKSASPLVQANPTGKIPRSPA